MSETISVIRANTKTEKNCLVFITKQLLCIPEFLCDQIPHRCPTVNTAVYFQAVNMSKDWNSKQFIYIQGSVR